MRYMRRMERMNMNGGLLVVLVVMWIGWRLGGLGMDEVVRVEWK